MTDFTPTKSMKRCREALHKSLLPAAVAALHPEEIDAKVIAPTPLPLFKRWLKDSSAFWEWLTTPPLADEKIEAVEKAHQFLIELFDMDIVDSEGKTDSAILRAKLDAAKMLIGGSEKSSVTINNNNQQAVIPKGIRGKLPAAIEEKIKYLEGAKVEDEYVND